MFFLVLSVAAGYLLYACLWCVSLQLLTKAYISLPSGCNQTMQSIFCSHCRAIVIEESEDSDSLPDPNPEQQQPQADNEAPAAWPLTLAGLQTIHCHLQCWPLCKKRKFHCQFHPGITTLWHRLSRKCVSSLPTKLCVAFLAATAVMMLLQFCGYSKKTSWKADH